MNHVDYLALAFPRWLSGYPTVTISVDCPCGKKLRANPENAGKKGRCPNCGLEFTIPSPELDADSQARMRALCAQAAALRCDWKKPGNVAQAEALFRKVVAEFPHFWQGHYGLASALYFLASKSAEKPDPGKRSEALAELRKTVKIDDRQHEPVLELAGRIAGQDIKEAEHLYRKGLKLADDESQRVFPAIWQAESHYRFAVAAAEADLTAIAIEAFSASIRLDPRRFTEVTLSPAQTKAKNCHRLAVKRCQQA